MPVIGEIKKGHQIGRKNSMQFMWCACDTCKKERWVTVVKGKPENTKCVTCCKIGRKIVYHGNFNNGAKEGDIKGARELGFSRKGTYIYAKCPNCDKLRWVQLRTVDKYKKCRKCTNIGRNKEQNGMWKGGIKENHAGYRMVRLYPNDKFYDMRNETGYAFEHRLIVAKRIERSLKAEEVVHHKDNNKANNADDNLELLPSGTIHLATIRMQSRINELEEVIRVLTNTK